jgi:aspartyl-tRNA(Asn)/glutamyl-tRNA(Gln) amidotransferase subunit A
MIKKSASEMASALSAGEITSVELTRAHLDQIANVDGDVHAFLHVDVDGAIAQARAVDEKRKSGEKVAPLAGVPLALKDVLVQKEFPLLVAPRCLKVGVHLMTPQL